MPEDSSEFVRAPTYVPRLSVDISQDQFERLQRALPHGLKGQVFRVIVEDLLDILENTSKKEAALAAILSRLVNVPAKSLE